MLSAVLISTKAMSQNRLLMYLIHQAFSLLGKPFKTYFLFTRQEVQDQL
jgi:hypothetical protein